MTEATPAGAPGASPDAQFQSLYDSGAFSTDGQVPNDAEQPERREEAQPEPKAAEAPAAPEVQPEGQPPEGEEQPASWENLDQFLTENQLDADQFKSIPVAVKIDGETRHVPLSDVIKSYQLEGHVNNKSMELSNARRAFDEEQAQVRQRITQQIQHNEALGKLAMEQLNVDYQRIDWNALRQNDPGQYAALFADFQQRQQAIGNYLGQIEQQKAQDAERARQELGQKTQTETQRLLDARPEWRDQAAFVKDRDQMVSNAKNNYGFSDAELNSIYDHRYMLVLHDAARFRALQAAKPEAIKRVREAPKMAKPGTRTNRDPSQVAKQNLKERFDRNPRDHDAAAAYFETLG